MGERQNIAEMAERVSKRIFSVFGWQGVGPKNTDWECVSPRHGAGTHPADVVLWYEHPYRNERIYVLTDLKSYASGSLTNAAIGGALSSLARATECAGVSSSFQDKYFHHGSNATVVGLLFIYNHDGEFDKQFHYVLDGVSDKNYRMAPKRRMFVFGPDQISYLANIANDVQLLQGEGVLPLESTGKCFHYPDLTRPSDKTRFPWGAAATIEMLTAPWIPLKYRSAASSDTGLLVYYRGAGSTSEEFLYLIDFLFRYQLVADMNSIGVRFVNPEPGAKARFEQARTMYAERPDDRQHVIDRLGKVSCESVTTIVRRFDADEIGMG